MKRPGPLSPEQQDFIRKNHKTLSSRRLAADLGVKRTDVEDFVRAIAEAAARDPFAPLAPGRERLWLAALLILGVLVRLYYLRVLGPTPFFEPLSKLLDDGVFDARGQAIAAGDWLGGGPWSWMVFLTPAYPYFLGVVYWLFGHSYATVHVLQTALGAFTPYLVYRLAQEAFGGRRAPLLAAALSVAYVPFVYYENLLVGESISIFLTLWALLLLARSLRGEDAPRRPIFAAGLIFGLAALFRPHLLVAVFFPVLYLGYFWAVERRKRASGAAAVLVLLAGLAAGMSPITLKNYSLYGEFIPISAIGGVNLYMSNNPKVEAGFAPTTIFGSGIQEIPERATAVAEKAEGRTLKPTEVSDYWKGRTVAYILGSPAGFARLMLYKTKLYFNRYEIADMRDMLFTAEFIPFLKPAAFEYGVVTVLALCGVLLCLPQAGAAARLLFSFAFGYSGAVLIFYVTSRYRVPVVPVFIVFAAAALDRAASAWRARDNALLSRFALAGALASLFVFYPIPVMNFSRSYNSLGIYFDMNGRYEESKRCYLKALGIDPSFADPYHNLALHYHFRAADEAKARAYEKRAQAIKDYARAHGAQDSGL